MATIHYLVKLNELKILMFLNSTIEIQQTNN